MIPTNSAHWHLMLNHLPILGTLVGIFLVILLFLRESRDWETLTLWWFVIMALLAIPVYLTGEPAEELVEGLAGVSHDAIEHHEEWAMWAFTLQEITGAFALFVLLYGRLRDIPGRWGKPMLLALVLLTAGFMGYTAALGGHIHHPETRPGFTPPEHDEEHEDEAATQEKASSKPKEAYPGTVDLKPEFRTMLRKEMRKIQTGMDELLLYLVRGQRTEASRIATRIHNSFILKQELSKQELKQLQNQLPAGFVELDQAFHKTAAKLAGAAKEGRMDEAMTHYHEMTGNCVTCHTRYARDRFSGLDSDASTTD